MSAFSRSEMYKVGPACSACPAGTECSERHPGLCAGEPTGAVTVRPPVRNFDGPAGVARDPSARPRRPPAVVNLPRVVIEAPSVGADKCEYECRGEAAGCSVKFLTRCARTIFMPTYRINY